MMMEMSQNMNSTDFNEKLEGKIVGQSSWNEKAKQRQIDRPWLKKSTAIAFLVLDALKSKGMTQVQLAEKLQVSPQQVNKIVKGLENLTLETISKLEIALDIQFFVPFEVLDFDSNRIMTNSVEIIQTT